MDNKMTAEQALEEFIAAATSPIYCANYEESEKWAEVIRQALSAPRVPESIDRLREASAKGFSTSKSCGPDGKYQSVTEFRSLSDLQDYERARIALLAASPEPVAKPDGGSWEEETHS